MERSIAVALAAWLASCSRGDPSQIVAGVWAVRGKVTYKDSRAPEGRTLAAGQVVRRGGVLDLHDADVALEGFGGTTAHLGGSRRTKVSSIKRIEAALAQREVKFLRHGRIETRKLGAFPVAARYDVTPDVAEDPIEREKVENLSYFFAPKLQAGAGPETGGPPPAMQSPDIVRRIRHVHGIRVRPPPPDPAAPRALVASSGPVVVELEDMTAAFAADLELPLALDVVRRIAVLDGGKADVRWDGTAYSFRDGDDVYVVPR